MKFHSLAIATLVSLQATLAMAADTAPKPKPAPAPTPVSIAGMFRVLKADGSTVVNQAIVSPGTMLQIGVKASDAIVAANGRCAFNVKIDEVSQATLAATTTRLYSNDTLVANVTQLDLKAATAKTFVTQPYLYAGNNNVKLVFNAESATPTIGWVRVIVDGTCLALPTPAPTPPVVTPAPKPPVAAVPPVKAGSGADWNALFNAYGYSNYGVTQLKGKGYRRYDELASVNAALVAVVKAGSIERTAYAALMARWNAIANDADFRAAMAKVVPGTDKR